MADPVSAIFITTSLLAAGGSVIGGIQANKAAKEEASLQEEQARIASEEAKAEAQRRANEVRKFSRRQSLAFLKSGVTLEGSPLLILDETLREGQKEVKSVVERGDAQANLFNRRAAITRNQGRASLIGGVLGAAGSLSGSAVTGRKAGLF